MRRAVIIFLLALPADVGLAAGERRVLQPEDEATIRALKSPAISPDGAMVAYVSGNELCVISTAGGKRTRVVAEGQTGSSPAWSPSGEQLAFLSWQRSVRTQVWLAPRSGSPAAALTKFEGDVSGLAWSPDGKRLAVVVSTTHEQQGLKFIGTPINLDLLDAPLADAFAIIARASCLAVRPDPDVGGRITLRLIETPWDQALEVILRMQALGSRREYNPDSLRIAPQERLDAEADDGARGLAADSSQLEKYTGSLMDLDVVDMDLRDVFRLFADISGLNVVVYPDVQGKTTVKFEQLPWDQILDVILKMHGLGYALDDEIIRIAPLSTLAGGRASTAARVFRSEYLKRDGHGYLSSETTRHQRIHLVDVATGESFPLTSSGHFDRDPRWSPDGRLVVFTSDRAAEGLPTGRHTLTVETTRTATPTPVLCAGGNPFSPVFRPDGTGIACIDSPTGFLEMPRIRLVDLDGTVRGQVALDRPVLDLRFSADGAWLYFIVEDSGRRSLVRVPSAGTLPPEPVVAGERRVGSYDLAPSGTVAFVASEPTRPDELFVLASGRTHQLTEENADLLAKLKLGPVERLRAKSADGTGVEAFLVRPPGAPAGARLPTVLRIHGGPLYQYTSGFEFDLQVLAAQGYAVLAPNPRGSTGYGTAFATAIRGDWGQRDFEDVMAVVDEAIDRGVADPQHLGVGGWSYGGYLTNVIVTRTKRFRAAVAGAGMANLFSIYGADDTEQSWVEEFGEPWNNVERWRRASPFFHVENVETPILIMCGENDLRTPVSQSEQWFTALRRLGRRAELVLYPGEGHNSSVRRSQDAWRREIAWYDRFLKVPEQRLAKPNDRIPDVR